MQFNMNDTERTAMLAAGKTHKLEIVKTDTGISYVRLASPLDGTEQLFALTSDESAEISKLLRSKKDGAEHSIEFLY